MKTVHVVPSKDDQHRIRLDARCWCKPRIETSDPATGRPYAEGNVLVHHIPPEGYPKAQVDLWSVWVCE